MLIPWRVCLAGLGFFLSLSVRETPGSQDGLDCALAARNIFKAIGDRSPMLFLFKVRSEQ